MEEFEKILKEIDDNFIGIKEAFDDNTEAHETLNNFLTKVDDAIMALHERISAIEQHLSEFPTPDKVYYKPNGQEDYLNMKANYDLIYERLDKLEGK